MPHHQRKHVRGILDYLDKVGATDVSTAHHKCSTRISFSLFGNPQSVAVGSRTTRVENVVKGTVSVVRQRARRVGIELAP